MAAAGNGLGGFFVFERHFHLDTKGADLAVLDLQVLFHDFGDSEVTDALACPFDRCASRLFP